MTRHDVLFWVCAVGTAIDIVLAMICNAVPELRSNVNVFAFSGFLMGIGMVANYINCLQAKNTKKK